MNLEANIRWADAFILMYSVTDKCSFDECNRLKFLINYNKRRKKIGSNYKVRLLEYDCVSLNLWYRFSGWKFRCSCNTSGEQNRSIRRSYGIGRRGTAQISWNLVRMLPWDLGTRKYRTSTLVESRDSDSKCLKSISMFFHSPGVERIPRCVSILASIHQIPKTKTFHQWRPIRPRSNSKSRHNLFTIR